MRLTTLYIHDSWHGPSHPQVVLHNSPSSTSLVASFPSHSSDILPKTQSFSFYPTTSVQATHASIRMPFKAIDFTGTRVPLTSLAGAEFVKAWLEVVKLHAFLCSRNIKFGDPNLLNTMYDEDLKCGVLVDYDLSIFQRQPLAPRVDPRTQTIPFMAVDLLNDECRNGKIEREYQHELEAFIWMLLFVFLRYQKGKPQRGSLVDPWMTSVYRICAEQKDWFWSRSSWSRIEEKCQTDFKNHVKLVLWLLFWMRRVNYSSQCQRLGLWGETNDSSSLVSTGGNNGLASIWPAFVAELRFVANLKTFPSLDYIDKLVNDLGLESPIWLSNA